MCRYAEGRLGQDADGYELSRYQLEDEQRKWLLVYNVPSDAAMGTLISIRMQDAGGAVVMYRRLMRRRVALARYLRISPAEVEEMDVLDLRLYQEELNSLLEQENPQRSATEHWV